MAGGLLLDTRAFVLAATSAVLVTLVSASASFAQQGGGVVPAGAQPAGAAQPPAATKPKAGPQKPSEGQAAPTGGDSGLRQRVEQLEEQLVDMQVVIGTLESLARSGGPRPQPAAPVAGGAYASGDQARFESIETQIRALTSQVEQLAQEVRAMGGAPGAGAPVPGQRSDLRGSAPDATLPPPTQGGYAPQSAEGVPAAGAGGERFGSTTVTSDELDPIGSLVEGTPTPPPASPQDKVAAAAPTATAGANPKELYERAYGFLLQQDYASAQQGFKEFLKSYPKDKLAPDALYWLGEVHYVQRNYADASEAFDLVTTAYGGSTKAADAQLKRGMSLSQLGKKQEACTVWRDMATKYPSAPEHVKSKAETERRRAGCT